MRGEEAGGTAAELCHITSKRGIQTQEMVKVYLRTEGRKVQGLRCLQHMTSNTENFIII